MSKGSIAPGKLRSRRMAGVLFAGLAAALLLAAACGGDDDDDGGSEPTVSSPVVQPTGDEPDGGDDGNGIESETPAASPTDDDDGGGGPATADVCALFTPEEVASLLGAESVAAGEETSPIYSGFSGCQWNSNDEANPQFALIEVSVGERAYHESTYENWRLYNDPQPVDGVGEMAQWDSLTNQIDVIDGDRYVIVQVLTGAGDDQTDIDIASEFAEAALQRVR